MINNYKRVSFEFVKFGLVGVLNTGIHLLILYCLTEFLGFYYVLASVIGFLVAVTNSFFINTFWTFKKDLNSNAGFKYSKFFIISALAAFVNFSLLFVITEYFHVWYIFSQLMATFFSLVINFMGNKFWTYK